MGSHCRVSVAITMGLIKMFKSLFSRVYLGPVFYLYSTRVEVRFGSVRFVWASFFIFSLIIIQFLRTEKCCIINNTTPSRVMSSRGSKSSVVLLINNFFST